MDRGAAVDYTEGRKLPKQNKKINKRVADCYVHEQLTSYRDP